MTVTVIDPSFKLQSVVPVGVVELIVAAVGATSVACVFDWHEVKNSRTKMVNVPPPRFEKVLPVCQFAPLSIENWRLFPVACTTIEPLFVPQPIGFEVCVPAMLGPAAPLKITGFWAKAVAQVPSFLRM